MEYRVERVRDIGLAGLVDVIRRESDIDDAAI